MAEAEIDDLPVVLPVVPVVYTIGDVAKILKVAPGSVLGLIRRGLLPSTRIGPFHRIRRESVIDFMAKASSPEPLAFRDPCRHGKKPTGRPPGTGKARKPRSRKAGAR